jgi:hypothetical protein
MQNAKRKTQIGRRAERWAPRSRSGVPSLRLSDILTFAFCTLHFAFLLIDN